MPDEAADSSGAMMGDRATIIFAPACRLMDPQR
jgi:hypothetical protein